MTAGSQGGPIAIGGVGGSGTRVVAAILRELGCYIGDDLNGANDNLWFTLFFKRRNVLVETSVEFARYYELFRARMNGSLSAALAQSAKEAVMRLSSEDRIQHNREWLASRTVTFLNPYSTQAPGQEWAWKEPNTHVVIDRILDIDPSVRYIHVFRDPFHMTSSKNRNQIENWGPIFLGRNCTPSERDALAYWCATQKRITRIAEQHQRRVLLLDFDRLCMHPEASLQSIANFLQRSLSPLDTSRLVRIVNRKSSAAAEGSDLSLLDPKDVEFAQHFYIELAALGEHAGARVPE